MNIKINNYYDARKVAFDKIQKSSTFSKVIMAFIMVCVIGIMAQIVIPLPWTPVPITAQTFAILCSGLILGKKYGCLSQIIYVILGVAFIPWFGGMTGGLETLLGSTGGYLIGFIFASYFIGHISQRSAKSRNFKRMIVTVGIANFAIIYIPGLLGLALWFYLTQGSVLGIIDLLIMGFIPFIFGDIIKVLGAASISKIFLPKE